MKQAIASILVMSAVAIAAPAAAQVKCISLPQKVTGTDPGTKFEMALLQSRICADFEAYKLSSQASGPSDIGETVVTRCRAYVEEQADYAVLANLGWTRKEVVNRELSALTEKALEAARTTRAGKCPATMIRSDLAAKL